MKCKLCDGELKLKVRLVKQSSDEIKTHTLQWWKCKKCDKKFFGELTDYIIDGSYEYAMYLATEEVWNHDVKLVRTCASPEDPHCNCKIHHYFFESNYNNRIDYSYNK